MTDINLSLWRFNHTAMLDRADECWRMTKLEPQNRREWVRSAQSAEQNARQLADRITEAEKSS
jgi:hypothetical protein